MYHGDIHLGDTIDVKFTTRQFSTGAPFLLGGSPVISAYIDNDGTQLTAGITLSANFDSVTGLNNVRVVATTGNGYTINTNVSLVITTGTVDSVSVVGEVVGSFSIDKRGLANGYVHGGATAKMELGSSSSTPALLVQSSGGDAARLLSSGGNGDGLQVTGHGDGSGLQANGGATGIGGAFVGVNGMFVSSSTDVALYVVSNGGDAAIFESTSGGGDGLKLLGNGAGDGLYAEGGVTGDGIHALGGATSGDGIDAVGQGTGVDIRGDITGNLTGNVSGSVGSLTTNNDKTGYALSAGAIDAILDDTIGDSTITVRQSLKLLVATLGGKLSGAATTTVIIRNAADTTDVVTATVDADGNRTAVTLSL